MIDEACHPRGMAGSIHQSSSLVTGSVKIPQQDPPPKVRQCDQGLENKSTEPQKKFNKIRICKEQTAQLCIKGQNNSCPGDDIFSPS